MKLNERSLVYYATNGSPADNTGFLYKRSERNATYRRRWFVLKGNMLFYFDDKDPKEPVGGIILEGCTVELCESTEEFEFTFVIRFECAKSRPYILAANSHQSMVTWVKAISRANFDYMRFVVNELQQQLDELQQAMTAGVVAQKRKACRKNKSICISNSVPRNTDREEVDQSVVCYNQVRENGCAVWDNIANTDVVPNGHCLTATWERPALHDGGSEENPKVPPLPPRRRKNIHHPSRTADIQSNGPAPQGRQSFSKLHARFGKEIVDLRKEWLERQPKPDQ